MSRIRPFVPALAALLAAALLAGCGSRGPAVRDLAQFKPGQGQSFILRADAHMLAPNGRPVLYEEYAAQVQQAAVAALESRGYRHRPSREPDFSVQVEMLCADPRLAAFVEEERLGVPEFKERFLPWDEETHAWSKSLIAEAGAPESCRGAVLILALPDGDSEPPYAAQIRVDGCRTAGGCPFSACREAMARAVSEYLKSRF